MVVETSKANNNLEGIIPSTISKPKGFGARHGETCWMFCALTFGYFLRVNMSVAIVAMTDKSGNPNTEYFDWNSITKSLILSSFFWGYVLAQVPSGILAQRYGPKIVLSIGTAICSVLTVLVPIGASLGDWQVVIFLRILIGFCQGAVYPCVHTLLSKWAPNTERGFLSTFIYSGAQMGTVLMLALSGVMSETPIGWPSLFYFSGTVSFVWSFAYLLFGADSPAESKYISMEERLYIESLTGNTQPKGIKVPWRSLSTSVPFIALIFAHCGFTWGFYTLLTNMPNYISQVLGLNIQANALLSALPYFVMWLLCLVMGPLADILINKGITSVELNRKIFNSIGQWVPMVALIALAYMTKDNIEIAIFLLTIAVGFNSASYCGYLVNHMDLSPNFAGTMMGITNGISNLMSIMAPLMVGAIVENESDPSQWRIVFFISAGVYLVCNSVFVIFGKATIQPFNDEIEYPDSSANSNNAKFEHTKT